MTARVVGILILGAFLAYGLGSALATSVASAPDYVSSISTNSLFTAGGVLMLLNSAIVFGIGVLMFPILRPHNKNIALGYFSTRIFEGTFLTVGAISLLSLVTVSKESARLGAPDSSYFEALGALAINGNLLAYHVAMAGLCFGSLFFCYLLFRSRLVPRFLAAWGFIGYAVFLAGAVLGILGFVGVGVILAVPGGLFEVFFGIWLIVKGFNPSAFAAVPAKTAGVLVP